MTNYVARPTSWCVAVSSTMLLFRMHGAAIIARSPDDLRRYLGHAVGGDVYYSLRTFSGLRGDEQGVYAAPLHHHATDISAPPVSLPVNCVGFVHPNQLRREGNGFLYIPYERLISVAALEVDAMNNGMRMFAHIPNGEPAHFSSFVRGGPPPVTPEPLDPSVGLRDFDHLEARILAAAPKSKAPMLRSRVVRLRRPS